MLKRVLLIDDEIALTRGLKLNLQATGQYEIRCANSGRSGLAMARQFHPHIVFLDLMMPDLDGTDVAASLREQPGFGQTPIVFVTAVLQKAESRSSDGVIGGQIFLAKPVQVAQVVECIEKYC